MRLKHRNDQNHVKRTTEGFRNPRYNRRNPVCGKGMGRSGRLRTQKTPKDFLTILES